jgi:hypothetical protein
MSGQYQHCVCSLSNNLLCRRCFSTQPEFSAYRCDSYHQLGALLPTQRFDCLYAGPCAALATIFLTQAGM